MRPGIEILQGILTTSPTVLYTVPSGVVSKIVTMMFTNVAAYNLVIKKYDATSSSLIQVYQLALNAGDIVNDDLVYLLYPTEYIEVTSSTAGTTYYISCNNTTT